MQIYEWQAPIHEEINNLSKGLGRAVKILDAGGGKKSYVSLPEDRYLTVLDLDEVSLSKNSIANEKIHGDIRKYDFGDRRFDLIICWDLLEHISDPESVVVCLCALLETGGLFLIKGPVPSSFKAIFTKMTPHFVHVLFYKHVLKSPRAGQPGAAPFRVELSADADDSSLVRTFERLGLSILARNRFETDHVSKLRQKSRIAYGIYIYAAKLMMAATIGRYGTLQSDFYVIGQKPKR